MRIQRYTGLGCPDDPARVADYGAMPWERDIEPVTISDAAAVDVITEALTTKRGAYGMTHDELLHNVADLIFNADDDAIREVIFAARKTDAVGKACGFLANEYQEGWNG